MAFVFLAHNSLSVTLMIRKQKSTANHRNAFYRDLADGFLAQLPTSLVSVNI